MTINEANFTFLGDLEWFLSRNLRGSPVHLAFEDHQTVKHLIEALGVPHVEVGSVNANETEVPLNYRPRNGDILKVLPVPPGCPVEPCFVLDNHLGRLAASLRMLGFDCLYHNDFEDAEMASLLENDGAHPADEGQAIADAQSRALWVLPAFAGTKRTITGGSPEISSGTAGASVYPLSALQRSIGAGGKGNRTRSAGAENQVVLQCVLPVPGLQTDLLEGITLGTDARRNSQAQVTKNLICRGSYASTQSKCHAHLRTSR